jgi:hypothetical protein
VRPGAPRELSRPTMPGLDRRRGVENYLVNSVL